MEKYALNRGYEGFKTVQSGEVADVSDSEILVVLNEKDEEVSKYYMEIREAIIRRNRVILVSSAMSPVFRALASLMISLGEYDIYNVMNEADVTDEYIKTTEEREPDLMEVQNFLGGDLVAYDRMEDVLMQMKKIAEDADQEALNEYIDKNMGTIERMAPTLSYMRKKAEESKSGELKDIVEQLKGKEEELRKQLEKAEGNDKGSEIEKEFKKKIEQLEKEKEAAESRAKNLDEQVSSGTPVISYYSEVNMAYIKHKIQRVLYFKEISYVPYTMSLIKNMYDLLSSARKLRVKCVIYDNSTEIYEPYIAANMKIINTKNYTVNKPLLLGTNGCVITEPNPAITSDLLTASDGFDVLIIYDRMHKYENIVTGNNVTRIFVASSSREVEETRKKFNITVNDMLITRKGSRILSGESLPKRENIVDIATIAEYSSQTDSAKVSKYSKMTASDGKRVFDKIFDRANITALF